MRKQITLATVFITMMKWKICQNGGTSLVKMVIDLFVDLKEPNYPHWNWWCWCFDWINLKNHWDSYVILNAIIVLCLWMIWFHKSNDHFIGIKKTNVKNPYISLLTLNVLQAVINMNPLFQGTVHKTVILNSLSATIVLSLCLTILFVIVVVVQIFSFFFTIWSMIGLFCLHSWSNNL